MFTKSCIHLAEAQCLEDIRLYLSTKAQIYCLTSLADILQYWFNVPLMYSDVCLAAHPFCFI